MICANDRQESTLPWSPVVDGDDAVGEEEVMGAEVGADADKEIVDNEEVVDADEELVPETDEAGVADGVAGAAEDEDGSGQGGFNSRPDGPNVMVFCPANFIFFVFGGISTLESTQKND